MSLHGHQAAQAAGQAAAVTGRGVALLHQPPHGLNTIVHGHQLPQDPHISRTQVALLGERTLGSATPDQWGSAPWRSGLHLSSPLLVKQQMWVYSMLIEKYVGIMCIPANTPLYTTAS